MKHKNIFALFCRYASLNVLGMVGLSCYILADTVFVARGVGADGLTALNLAIPIYSFVHGAGLMVGMGGATRYAISGSRGSFTQGLYYLAGLSVLFVGAGVLLPGQLATLLGGDAVTHGMTSTYLQVILCFAPMFMLNNYIICFVRNDGSPRLAMLGMLIGSLSNVVLDYLFIFPLGMGIFGAALATGVSPVISLLILSSHFLAKHNSFTLCPVGPHIKELWDISTLGVSALITELSSGIVIIVFNSIILRLAGNLGVAAYGVIANISLVILSIFTGVAQGVQPIISKSYGTGNREDVGKLLQYGLLTTITFAVVAYAVSFFFARPIVELFNKEHNPQLTQIAVNGMRIYFSAFVFVGVNILSATYFSAIERSKTAFTLSLLRGFVVVIPAALLLSALFGLNGVWITTTVSECIVAIYGVTMLVKTQRQGGS